MTSLLVDGMIGGVIAVVGFLPLIMIMFFLMALFEDCGYMARVAVVMDRFFKRSAFPTKRDPDDHWNSLRDTWCNGNQNN